jgi:DNA-binding PadR family transcriptional regulator
MKEREESRILTPFSYQILLALADEERHGYGIIKEIEERSGVGSVPSTGAMYLALQRLEEAGLIEESAGRRNMSEDARRRYYRLTGVGRSGARAETIRLAGLVGTAVGKRLVTAQQASRLLGQGGGGHGR